MINMPIKKLILEKENYAITTIFLTIFTSLLTEQYAQYI